eukprot:scaffold125866_cov57-Phaeocystis_antarctica.AAC.2
MRVEADVVTKLGAAVIGRALGLVERHSLRFGARLARALAPHDLHRADHLRQRGRESEPAPRQRKGHSRALSRRGCQLERGSKRTPTLPVMAVCTGHLAPGRPATRRTLGLTLRHTIFQIVDTDDDVSCVASQNERFRAVSRIGASAVGVTGLRVLRLRQREEERREHARLQPPRASPKFQRVITRGGNAKGRGRLGPCISQSTSTSSSNFLSMAARRERRRSAPWLATPRTRTRTRIAPR